MEYITGPKGGVYYLDEKGKKHYIKKTKKGDLKKSPSPRQLKKYTFRAYTQSDPEDGEWLWAKAYSESEARQNIESDYWNITRLELYSVE